MIRIEIPGEPVPQNVGKVGRWKAKDGREGTTIRQPGKVVRYKLEAQERMKRALPGGYTGFSFFEDWPVVVRLVAIFELPVSRHRKRNPPARQPHTSRYGNCDNLVKAIADAAEGILWDDDGQIFDLHVSKWWGAQGERPGVFLEVLTVAEAAAPTPPPPAGRTARNAFLKEPR